MKALVSPNEPAQTGYRIADVASAPFEVASPLFWVDCADNVVADQFWFDPQDETIKQTPQPEGNQQPQPTVDGAQTL